MSTTAQGRTSTAAVIFVLGAVAFLFYRLQLILLPFVVPGLLAYLCNPIINWMASKTRLSRSFFAVIAFVTLVLIATLVGIMGLPPLLAELTRIITDFQGTLTRLAHALIGDGTANFFGRSMNATQLAQTAESAVRDWIGEPGKILELGEIAFSTAFGFFLSIVLLFYFLYSGPSVMRRLLWLLPPAQRPFVLDIWCKLDPILKRYFVGVLIIVTYAATAAYIGLGVVLQLPHAIPLAVLTGLLEMIPIIGPAATIVIAGLVAVGHATGLWAITAYAIYAMALRLSIDQLFGPLRS